MKTQTAFNESQPSEMPPSDDRTKFPKLKFPITLIVIYWGLYFIVANIEKPYFYGFMYGMASAALFTLCFLAWWWFNRSIRLLEKLVGFLLIFGGAWLSAKFAHRSVGIMPLFCGGVPLVMSLIVAWMFIAKRKLISSSRIVFILLVAITWSYFLLIRTDGVDSNLKTLTRWRWTPSAEEIFLTQKTISTEKQAPARSALPTLPASAEWSGFRGQDHDGVVHGTRIATDWKKAPPQQIWKHPVGPAWSSMTVIGNRLYTQEQRGEKEAVVCYDASTGSQIWIHEDTARFEEAVSGAGPRATPTFVKGRILTLGATGILNCLDATTGKVVWSREINRDSGAKAPLWGFSSSPLIVDQKVVVYAGGDTDKGLLAYRLGSGELLWGVPAGQSSYSSAQLTTLAGMPQFLMLHDCGLTAVDPADGEKLWETGLAMKGAPRSGQPRLIGENKLAVAALDGPGITLLEVTKTGAKWNVSRLWASKDLKPEFPDFVIHGGYAYGFDVSIFCCLNLADGKRTWKEGRYGCGQVILLADQALLLVISEKGEAILLAADPQAQKELGRFQVVQGKTWNHPVLANGRLYVRNAEEMACYAMTN